MYQIDGRDQLFDWLSRETDQAKRQLMLDWLVGFASDPLDSAQRLPGVRAPIYIAKTFVPRVLVVFLHAEMFKTVRILEFRRMP